MAARRRQYARAGIEGPAALNARVGERRLRRCCTLTTEASKLLVTAQKQRRISARGRSHVLRVARTIADLEGASVIAKDHVAEAVQYRIRELPV